MKIDGELINIVRFADDIFVCTSKPQKLDWRGKAFFVQSDRKFAWLSILLNIYCVQEQFSSIFSTYKTTYKTVGNCYSALVA